LIQSSLSVRSATSQALLPAETHSSAPPLRHPDANLLCCSFLRLACDVVSAGYHRPLRHQPGSSVYESFPLACKRAHASQVPEFASRRL
jgi:hypothetical protein